ncbi:MULTISPECIES: hypothetical protein [Micromonospora]|uniref:Uncharacterized protein n=1 Tax=Micromonospora solifontis TaxID=2487138 RepID=A0ABX9WGA5_9ACTN|nr:MULTISPECIES: hypothetical protein [Micromonospora]NES12327.1 hypothetical protein [Micromonospora sp. PPF5-17B]NES37770.1 hypothetical protein [Micromonospora solifontis]NES54190.1 hypothetical protein [Micromonospora sp. PPF5-6]RNL97965.1 hypothetical protein EFE23_16680 [Micromonospora solifontis]
MGTTDPGSAREEAERLVATLLATARLAAAAPGAGPWGPLGGILSGVLGHTPAGGDAGGAAAGGTAAGGGFATGSPECCVCPICRGIAALRDPSPEFAERLATGAGDLAAGVASLLRAFAPAEPAAPGADGGEESIAGNPTGDHVWREATRTGHDSQPAPEQDVWSAATRGEGAADSGAVDGSRSRRGVRRAELESSESPADVAGPDAPVTTRPPAGRPVVPASRVSGEVGEDAPGDGA